MYNVDRTSTCFGSALFNISDSTLKGNTSEYDDGGAIRNSGCYDGNQQQRKW